VAASTFRRRLPPAVAILALLGALVDDLDAFAAGAVALPGPPEVAAALACGLVGGLAGRLAAGRDDADLPGRRVALAVGALLVALLAHELLEHAAQAAHGESAAAEAAHLGLSVLPLALLLGAVAAIAGVGVALRLLVRGSARRRVSVALADDRAPRRSPAADVAPRSPRLARGDVGRAPPVLAA